MRLYSVVKSRATTVGKAILVCLYGLPNLAVAQFLRLGPFDIDVTANLDAIYSSNPNQMRESQDAGGKRDDYWLLGRLSFDGRADLTENLKLSSGFAIEQEKHFKMRELDERTRSDPFGRADVNVDWEFGRYKLGLNYAHESTWELKQGLAIEASRKKRTWRRSDSASAQLRWERERLRFYGMGSVDRDRYQEEAYTEGDEDSASLDLGMSYDVTRRIRAKAEYSQTRDRFPNRADDYEGWDRMLGCGLVVLVLEEPQFTYEVSMVKEKSQGRDLGWQPSHTFNLIHDFDLAQNLTLSVDANYNIKRERGPNEIDFTYGGTLSHEISRTAQQSFRATREPAETFGSTLDTDTTKFEYRFSKRELFIYGLSLNIGISYTIEKPIENEPHFSTNGVSTVPDQRTLTYMANVTWTRKVSRKMDRTVAYDFIREKVDIIEEPVVEHRVTLSYVYRF